MSLDICYFLKQPHTDQYDIWFHPDGAIPNFTYHTIDLFEQNFQEL